MADDDALHEALVKLRELADDAAVVPLDRFEAQALLDHVAEMSGRLRAARHPVPDPPGLFAE